MPRPPIHGLTETARWARILRYLVDAGGEASSTDIRSGIVAYDADTDHSAWRRDLRRLRERGLVQVASSKGRSASTVKLRRPVKPTDLFLTLAEHRALVRARTLLDADPPPTPEVAGAPAGLVPVLRLVRHLEERPGVSLTFREAADLAGQPPEALLALLRQVTEFDAAVGDRRRHLALDLDYMPPDGDDADGYVTSTTTALGTALTETLNADAGTGNLLASPTRGPRLTNG